MAKLTLKGIKKKADKVFSEFVRRTKSHKEGLGTCVTCGVIKPWKELQNGHYFPRNRLGTRFHEDNCHLQCPRCNIFLKGNYTAYASYMFSKYGPKKVEHLEYLSRKPLKLTINDYHVLIEGWKTMLKNMETERSIGKRAEKWAK